MTIPEISPGELHERISAGERWTILDVREAHELAIAAVAEALHIPMGDVPLRLGELEREAALAVLCHGGGRSARVTAFLRQQGFGRAVNIAGGIDRWAIEVDPGLARY